MVPYAQSTATVYSFTTRETNTCQERGTSGLICQSCFLVATCVKSNGNWLTVPVESCDTDKGYYCNLNEHGCSNETGPCQPFGFEGNFACTSEGVFPDPYDCQKYHMCYKAGNTLVSANIDCGADKAFSAATGDCALTLKDSVCTQKQYACENSGESKSWPGNKNIFYICKATYDQGSRILYPTLYRCASGEIFNGNDCVPRSITDIDVLPFPDYPIGPFRCSVPGLYKDEVDCHAYYQCDILGNARKYSCPTDTHFDDRIKSCARGTCK